MKIQQENLPYRPITIKLEKQAEARAFFELFERMNRAYRNDRPGIEPEHREVIASIVEAMTRLGAID